jgi:hypothetical protein
MTRETQLLQVVREPIKARKEAEYAAIESESAHACAEWKCPHPYLALEPVGGPKEIWWLNTFASEAERQRVTDEYAKNGPLMEILVRNSWRKASLTGTSSDRVLEYRAELSGSRWEAVGVRFLAVTGTTGEAEGAVFEAVDGTRLVLRPARTREEAEGFASAAGGETMVLAVLPSWGMPAKEWMEADPEFWAPNPAMQTVRRQGSAVE